MADFSSIIQEINADITTNGVGAITGAKLNQVLRDMIDAVNDKKDSKLIVSDITRLNQEQIESLRVGDSVVEYKNGKNVAYLVAQKENNVTKIIRTGLNTIYSVQYNLYTFGGMGMCFLAERAPYSIDGHLAMLNSSGNPTDSGIAAEDVVTKTQYEEAIASLQQQIDELKNQ